MGRYFGKDNKGHGANPNGMEKTNFNLRTSITAIFEIGFHALRKKIVSGTLSQNTLVLTRLVLMQELLRQNYTVLLFQNTVTTSVLYTCKKQWIVKRMVARENRSES